MRRLRLRIICLAVLLGLITALPAGAITGGQPDDGAHPYVGLMYAGSSAATFQPRCSGFLLAPKVFLTAGHCLPSFVPDGFEVGVTFASPGLASSPMVSGAFYRMPGFCQGCGTGLPGFHRNDLAVVVLKKKGPDGGYPELPAFDSTASLASNTPVTIVGYGFREGETGNPDELASDLQRYRATTTLIANDSIYYSNGFLRLQANKSGVCFGDSGGPNLVGGTVVGVNSFVPNGNVCEGVSYSTRLDTQAALDFVGSFLPHRR